MWKFFQLIICVLLAMHAQIAWSSDACSTRAIVAAADVTVSDGSSFKIESFFHSSDAAAIRHISEDEQLIAVEGPYSWTRLGDKSELGSDFHKVFALGHQFHAFLLYFEELVTKVRRSEEILFDHETHRAISGNYPYGGVVHLIESDTEARPVGILFEFPETTAITVNFYDWRDVGDAVLPFHLRIDDGERSFDYRYSQIDIASRSPLWYLEAVGTPDIDQVQVYRLHRKLLAAHCLGDADMMATLSAPQMVIAGRGELLRVSNAAMHEQFTALFQRLEYTEYHDIVMPIIEISSASDLAWIGVNVRAIGSDKKTDTPFDDQWAWVMMVEKINNDWVHAGNASNRLE